MLQIDCGGFRGGIPVTRQSKVSAPVLLSPGFQPKEMLLTIKWPRILSSLHKISSSSISKVVIILPVGNNASNDSFEPSRKV